jgi:hypothetical protein
VRIEQVKTTNQTFQRGAKIAHQRSGLVMTEYSYSERSTPLKRVDVNISKYGVWLCAEAGTRPSMEVKGEADFDSKL